MDGNNLLIAATNLIIVTISTRIITTLTRLKYINSKLSRKIIHIITAPLCLLFWPFYSADKNACYLASVVPFANCLRLIYVGYFSNDNNHELSSSLSRAGNRQEALQGPLIYTFVLLIVTIIFFKSETGIVTITQVAFGDGFADIIGRNFGKNNKLPFNKDKSYAGSFGFLLFSFTFSILFLWYFTLLNIINNVNELFIMHIFIVSLFCSILEAFITSVDDNIVVSVTAMIYCAYFL